MGLNNILLRHCSQFCNKAFYSTLRCVCSIISVLMLTNACIVRKLKLLLELVPVGQQWCEGQGPLIKISTWKNLLKMTMKTACEHHQIFDVNRQLYIFYCVFNIILNSWIYCLYLCLLTSPPLHHLDQPAGNVQMCQPLDSGAFSRHKQTNRLSFHSQNI